MPFLERDGARIYYEVHGEGFPVLLLASGGMRSSIPYWGKAPWDAITRLSPHYQVIAMDQRNAGQSKAPITEADGWQTYTADQVALLDHLGIARADVVGVSMGGMIAFQMAVANGVRAHHWRFGNMPAVEGVTQSDVDKIVAYVRALQRENGIF